MRDPRSFNVPTHDRVMNNEALVPHTSRVTVWRDLSLTVYLSGKISKTQTQQGKKGGHFAQLIKLLLTAILNVKHFTQINT